MAEDVARAVGAASPECFQIGGKDCYPRPLTIKELTEAERVCLADYRRNYIKAYADNADLLGKDGERIVREKFEEAARFTVNSLPTKLAYSAKGIKLTPSLEKWVEENYGHVRDVNTSKEEQDKVLHRIVATALDSELLTPELYTNLTGATAKAGRVGYVHWWITGTVEGMVTLMTLAFRDQEITKDQILEMISKNPGMMVNISREIERLSAPDVGNG